ILIDFIHLWHTSLDNSSRDGFNMLMLENLGPRIRELRKQKNITLIELSQKTNVAQATLSRIETGTMIGTVESHMKIAEALGVGLADLYDSVDHRRQEVVHLAQDKPRKAMHQSKGIQIELLTQEGTRKKIAPLMITLTAGSKTQTEEQERGVEKFYYILEGDVKVTLDGDDYLLKQGETLYFDASLPHEILNTGTKSARLLCAVSPPKI
nr:cupin domain-containing protein [Candidatus Omnitrophota bacterium]